MVLKFFEKPEYFAQKSQKHYLGTSRILSIWQNSTLYAYNILYLWCEIRPGEIYKTVGALQYTIWEGEIRHFSSVFPV